MIDELVLERLFAETADEIPVPDDGAERVVAELELSAREPRSTAQRSARMVAAVAAVVVVIVGVAVAINGASTGSSSKASLTAPVAGGAADVIGSPSSLTPSAKARVGRSSGPIPEQGAVGAAGYAASGSSAPSAPSAPPQSSSPVDGAKIVKTGTLDLQVSHDTLHAAVDRVSGIAVGLGGYIANSTTNYDGPDPTGQVTMRVPVGSFDAAVRQLKALPGVKVLGDSETGKDVTAQYTDLQAQLTAAKSEESALLDVLSHASSIGDILAVRDRITSVDTEINQVQGQINLLGDKADFSAIAITLAEKSVHTAVHVATPPTGLSKAWDDARQGFSNSVEWIIARSGGALIVLLAILVLMFGLRYLYPVVRRALL